MTKQEEIREGIKGELDMWLPVDCPQRETRLINVTNSVYEKLHKQGVVIKVDREFPLSPYVNPATDYQRGFNQALNTAAGYVEPLIKEEKL